MCYKMKQLFQRFLLDFIVTIFWCYDQCATPVRPFLRKAGLRKGRIGQRLSTAAQWRTTTTYRVGSFRFVESVWCVETPIETGNSSLTKPIRSSREFLEEVHHH